MKLVSPPTRQVRTWTTDSRRWSAYKPRPGDVVIATPAKTGTTWTQQIVTLLIHQTVENRPVMDIAPWIGMRVAPLDQMIAMLDAQTHRRAVKSHLPYDALPIYDEVRYIHVGRDGRDVMMSWHNHTTNYTPPALAAMDAAGLGDDTIARPLPRPPSDIHDFFREWIAKDNDTKMRDDFPATRFFDIEKSYWKHRHDENMLIVHYADLKADLGGEMRRIADFLGITVPEKLWPDLIEAATFELDEEECRRPFAPRPDGLAGRRRAFSVQRHQCALAQRPERIRDCRIRSARARRIAAGAGALAGKWPARDGRRSPHRTGLAASAGVPLRRAWRCPVRFAPDRSAKSEPRCC